MRAQLEQLFECMNVRYTTSIQELVHCQWKQNGLQSSATEIASSPSKGGEGMVAKTWHSWKQIWDENKFKVIVKTKYT